MVTKKQMGAVERIEAQCTIEVQMVDAIKEKMPKIFNMLNLPKAPVFIEPDPQTPGAVRFRLGDSQHYRPQFGSPEVQHAKVCGALAGVGLATKAIHSYPTFNADGSATFASINDLAICVESLAEQQVIRGGKYAHVIAQGPRAGHKGR